MKLSTWALTFEQAASKMVRNFRNLGSEGIKRIFRFLKMSLNIEKFLTGEYDTSFIDTTPELFIFPVRKDRGTKMLTYIGNVTVNGFPGIERKKKRPVFPKPRIPKIELDQRLSNGTKQILDEKGADGLVNGLKTKNKYY